ncbi:MAG: hypothetical protein II008_20725 [Oscillospiraceae bacterium]|nr:hypothetical protein [Oscillospiraceae bacterium]
MAKADILENQKKHKAGTEFETDDATGLVLIEYGWAAELDTPEKAETPKRTRKKA